MTGSVLIFLMAAAVSAADRTAQADIQMLFPGDTTILNVTMEEDDTVTFSSENEAILKVSDVGEVIAVRSGHAFVRIVWTYKAGKRMRTYRERIRFVVRPESPSKTSFSMCAGEERKVSFLLPDGYRAKWKSSSAKVASVDKNGVVTAKKKGKAVITGMAVYNDSGDEHIRVIATVRVTDSGADQVLSLMVNSGGYRNTADLKSFIPKSKRNKVVFSVSEPYLGTVTDGVYRAEEQGTNLVTAVAGSYRKVFRIHSYKWIAHRGDSVDYPENTTGAVLSAIQKGAFLVEIDLHATKDDVLVVLHDSAVNRTTNGSGYIHKLEWKDVRKLRVMPYGLKGTEEELRIPRLIDVLRLCRRNRGMLLIELKSFNRDEAQTKALYKEMYEELRRTGMLSKVAVSSLSGELLRQFRTATGNRVPVILDWGTTRHDKIRNIANSFPSMHYYAGAHIQKNSCPAA